MPLYIWTKQKKINESILNKFFNKKYKFEMYCRLVSILPDTLALKLDQIILKPIFIFSITKRRQALINLNSTQITKSEKKEQSYILANTF
jgi:hypothetical protein